MSRKFIGVGEGLVVAAFALSSAGDVALPRAFRIVDKWGSFFALAAAPSTKTNLDSRSFAIC